MKRSCSVLLTVIFFIFLILVGISYYARSIYPGDWIWSIQTEIKEHSKIDWWDLDVFYLGDDEWNFPIIHPFIDIDSSTEIESISIYTVQPVKSGKYHTKQLWQEGDCSIDEYFRENCDYMTKITGERPKGYVLLLLATSPICERTYDKNNDKLNISGLVIDFELVDGRQKTYIMIYDKQNVFYEKGIDEKNRIYRRMPKVLLEKFILTYSETMREFRKNK